MKNAGVLQIVIIIAIVIGLLTGVYMIAGCTIFKEKTLNLTQGSDITDNNRGKTE